MDQRDNGDTAQPHPIQASYPLQRQRPEVEVKDAVAARKVQKADREKLRRDRLNEQFLELGHSLDPDRPKNDKGTILTDTIQVLKDLTAEVNKLKAEYAAISEESRELTQEKNELKEEKASLKSEVDRLNLQYQQRLRVMFPWTAIEPSVVMTPSYPYPVPLPVPTGPIPVHPALQPFPFFGNQNPSAIANPCSTFIPYPSPGNHHIDQPSYQCASSSRISNKLDFKSKTSDCCRGSNEEKSEDSNDVVTELELKIPGSTTQQEHPAEGRKGKQPQRKEKSIVDGSSSSRHLSSPSFQESSSNSLGHPEVP
ncbi:transcription factor bHLH121-like [Diospyros lotus]|uniref:transcription factor bHLH121-like n=1 Tax=Diospyros lotus TaxID=55363 RepID=UPI00224F764E|nr:transcription factor bHLH121-like [Diospyros lotus]